MEKDNIQPLSNLKVIEVSSIIAGPMLGKYLADFGAEVLKIEHPVYGDGVRNLGHHKNGESLEWKHINRNKKPITLNLGKDKGKEIFLRLVKDADIFIENFRPGTMEKWGIGWDVLSKLNPGLIMVRISGFGQDGPYKNRSGFGTLAEAMSGYASINGYEDRGPLLPGFALADQVTALFGAYAVMVAQHYKNQSGKGQYIDLSIYEGLMSILGNQIMDFDQLGIIPKRMGNRMTFSVPRNLYQTKDNKWIAISGSAQSIVERIFRVIDREELINDPKFCNNQARQENADELDQIILDWVIERSQSEVLDHMLQHDVAIAPVYNIGELFDDPHIKARQNIISVPDHELGEVKMQNVVPKLSLTPGKVNHTGLNKGTYNLEVFKKLGFSENDLKMLKEQGII